MCSLGFNREVRLRSWSRSGWFFGALCGLGLAFGGSVSQAATTPAGSAAFPVSLALDLDGDGRTDQVTLSDVGQLSLRLSSQGSEAQALTLELGDRAGKLIAGSLSEQVLRSGQRFIVATGQKANRRQLSLWAAWQANRLTTIYNGPIGPVGSDGEYSLGIDVSDGVLRRYQMAPAVERCDGEKRLFVEQYGSDGRWLPDVDAVLAKLDGVTTISASGEPPRALASIGRPLGLYRLVATSRQVGIVRADLLTAPRELDDGQAQTAWRGLHDARGTFFTWRAETPGRSLLALRIDPAPLSQGVLPSQVVVTLSPKERYRVMLSGAVRPGRPLWVVLPQAVAASCVSLSIEQSGTRDGEYSAIGEVSVFSDLDGGDAQAVLVGQLGSTDMRVAEAAERALKTQLESGDTRRSEALIGSIAAVLPDSRGSTRRRLHALLGTLTSQSSRLSDAGRLSLRDALVLAIRRAEAEERAALFAGLGTLQSIAKGVVIPSVESLTTDASLSLPLRGEALVWLGDHGDPASLLSIGKQVSKEPTLRHSTQRALSTKLRCPTANDPRWTLVLASLGTDAQLASWQALLMDALAESALGCSDDGSKRLVADQLSDLWRVSQGYSDEVRFALRYRLLRALYRLDLAQPPSLLSSALQPTEPAELRQQAAKGLARMLPLPIDLAQRVLRDEDPGVRTSLLAGLLGRRQDALVPQLAQLLATDRWPMVRRAATDVLASQCSLGMAAGSQSAVVDALTSSLRDADEVVAQLGLLGLSRCLGSTGMNRYLAILSDGKASTAVRGGACVLVAQHGLAHAATADKAHQALADGLSDLIDDPMAGDRSVVAAVKCLRAIGEHGDGRDLPVLLGRLDREVPLGLRRGAAESVLRICQRQRSSLPTADQKGLAELLRMASEPSDGLLHGLLPKLEAACRPWSGRSR